MKMLRIIRKQGTSYVWIKSASMMQGVLESGLRLKQISGIIYKRVIKILLIRF